MKLELKLRLVLKLSLELKLRLVLKLSLELKVRLVLKLSLVLKLWLQIIGPDLQSWFLFCIRSVCRQVSNPQKKSVGKLPTLGKIVSATFHPTFSANVQPSVSAKFSVLFKPTSSTPACYKDRCASQKGYASQATCLRRLCQAEATGLKKANSGTGRVT